MKSGPDVAYALDETKSAIKNRGGAELLLSQSVFSDLAIHPGNNRNNKANCFAFSLSLWPA
jgi:hypothetical protein